MHIQMEFFWESKSVGHFLVLQYMRVLQQAQIPMGWSIYTIPWDAFLQLYSE